MATEPKPSLETYRRKRDFARTPEPAPSPADDARGDRFVIQEHHATALHWDFRLERDGVLVSWAVPKGMPQTPTQNHLAIHTEDHPLEYLDFKGDIPEHEYGGGNVTIWDRGTYETEKFRDAEVIVRLHGRRTRGKYVLFQTRRDQWMIHRMDPPEDPSREDPPAQLRPMRATPAERLPRGDGWAFDLAWGGLRAIMFIDGGRVRIADGNGTDVTSRFPEYAALGLAMGARGVIFDGEIVVLDASGKPDADLLAARLQATTASRARTKMKHSPSVYCATDLLFDEGHMTTSLPYDERRKMLEAALPPGANWRISQNYPPRTPALLDTVRKLGLAGLVAKRRSSPYRPGELSNDWREVGAKA